MTGQLFGIMTRTIPSRTIPHSSNPAIVTDVNQAIAVGAIIFLLPVMFVLSVVVQRQRRHRVMQQRITKLEYLWQLNPHQSKHSQD